MNVWHKRRCSNIRATGSIYPLARLGGKANIGNVIIGGFLLVSGGCKRETTKNDFRRKKNCIKQQFFSHLFVRNDLLDKVNKIDSMYFTNYSEKVIVMSHDDRNEFG